MSSKGKYDRVDKRVSSLELNEITNVKKSGRYQGMCVGKDKNGFFVSCRARSKSYESLKKIPESVLKFVKSTG